ncbi:MAG: hypothetical protein GX116_05905 [Fibrobacter sp.]|nr:hypothetical protein [Fibrobacter sp.]
MSVFYRLSIQNLNVVCVLLLFFGVFVVEASENHLKKSTLSKQQTSNQTLVIDTIKLKDSVFNDIRNSKTYPIIQIENTIWMMKNLAYDFSSIDTLDPKNCYLEDPQFCKKYGRYYTWKEASKACPSGWRLPNEKDWRAFIKNNGVDWKNMGRGGFKDWDSYGDASNVGQYWSISKFLKNKARAFEVRNATKAIDRFDEDIEKGLYVRCVSTQK